MAPVREDLEHLSVQLSILSHTRTKDLNGARKSDF